MQANSTDYVEVKPPQARAGARVSNVEGMPLKIERLLTAYGELNSEQRVLAENFLRKRGTKGLRELASLNMDAPMRMGRFGPEVLNVAAGLGPVFGFLLAALAIVAIFTVGTILLTIYTIYAAVTWSWIIFTNGLVWAVTSAPHTFLGTVAGAVAGNAGLMFGLSAIDGAITGGIAGFAVGTAFHIMQNVDWDYQKWWWANIWRANVEKYKGSMSLFGWMHRGIRSIDPEYRRMRQQKDVDDAAKEAIKEAAKTPEQKLKEKKKREEREKKDEKFEMTYGYIGTSVNGRLWISVVHGFILNTFEVFISGYGTAIVSWVEAIGRAIGITAIGTLIGLLISPPVGIAVAGVGVLMTLVGYLQGRWYKGPNPNVARRSQV